MNEKQRISRRDLLKSAAIAPFVGLAARASAAPAPRTPGLPRNVLLFITDQERAIQHFPTGWELQNLPGMTRLRQNGLSFDRAFTDACMCSPARSTLMSGYFPAQHGVKYTLQEDMPAKKGYPQVELPLNLPNIGTVMSAAGFNVVYKGKWHCSKPPGKHWVPKDVNQYGFSRWDPQDAGANQDINEGGGGYADNDGRFMYDDGQYKAGREGAMAYLRSVGVAQQPFFLIVSLVNPHDVLFYPNTYIDAGYDPSWLLGDIQIPDTVLEPLITKPTVQREFLEISRAGLGDLSSPLMLHNYINFYGNLMARHADNYLVEILDALEELNLIDDTLIIRTADHGEMGLTHGGQRQKNFNFYEESIRVPLVYSNPIMFKSPQVSSALVSHVDFLPTLANLFNAPPSARRNWQGIDYSSLLQNPAAPPVQDYIVFTYDDYQSGQKHGPYPRPPNHIASIREDRFKLAEYFDADGCEPSQWEMYDLLHDSKETHNLAFDINQQPAPIQAEYARLQAKLAVVKSLRLRPLA